MSHAVPPADEERRVKVYELRNHDWFDRGTGFCTGQIIDSEPTIVVKSEDQPVKTLLHTRISKDDGYQRQQETLIVWTESSGLDMALSFQEAEGCASIWDFVNHAQITQNTNINPVTDDGLSDDALDGFPPPVMPPIPELSSLQDIEHVVRTTSQTAQGRDQLSKFLLGEEYIRKLLPLVEMAEDLEALTELHRLNNIMKMFILLNDTQIVEYMVSEDVVMGVLAALEYDPEFPNYKANHREYLRNKSRFKEVVPIESPEVKKKIHVTWRLQYLKDVVLARILDDPTFGVLNSLIFFNQVDIVNHLQSNAAYMKELFSVVDDKNSTPAKRKDAITFIQQCCLLAKNLQTPARNTLYSNFVANGLIGVLTFALGSSDAGTRHAGLEILVAMIDHDAPAVRAHIHAALKEKRISLVDALIRLLHTERDLGAKAQTADAVKILLDPGNNGPHNPADVARQNAMSTGNAQASGAGGGPNGHGQGGVGGPPNANSIGAQTQAFVEAFYAHNAAALFGPLRDLESVDVARTHLSFTDSALQQYLIEILIFFVRHHHMRAKAFIGAQGLSAQIGKLLRCSSKHVALTAVKYFRTCLGLQDEFWFNEVTNNGAFGGIFDVLLAEVNRGRDNLLNSACLEVFDQVKREGIRPMIEHVVENYKDRLEEGVRVFGRNGGLDIFGELLSRYQQVQEYVRNGGGLLENTDGDQTESDAGEQLRAQLHANVGVGRWHDLREQDVEQEAYFAAGDDEEDDETLGTVHRHGAPLRRMTDGRQANGSPSKPLVPYDDEDSDEEQLRNPQVAASRSPRDPLLTSFYGTPPDVPEDGEDQPRADEHTSPLAIGKIRPDSVLEKRKRKAEEDDDELGKLFVVSKRRSSSSSASSLAMQEGSATTNGSAEIRKESGKGLRSKKSLSGISSSETGKGKKISISFTSKNRDAETKAANESSKSKPDPANETAGRRQHNNSREDGREQGHGGGDKQNKKGRDTTGEVT